MTGSAENAGAAPKPIDPASPDRPQGTRRTLLAAERTWLAWLRTGLAFGAVALAVGKIVPELSDTDAAWAYSTIGVGYALLGVVVLLYGLLRRNELDDALIEGSYVQVDHRVVTLVLLGGAVLGLAIAVVIVFE